MSTEQTLSQAWQRHQAGDLGQAEALYRLVLAEEPRHVEALCLLGLVYQRQERLVECVELYRRCLQAKPDFAEVHLNLGTALAALGQQSDAIACYKEVVRLEPDHAKAWTYLGLLETAHGDLDDALTSCQTAVALEPGDLDALSNLGIVHVQQHRVDEALRCFQEVVARSPQSADGFLNLGGLLLQQGKLTEAEECYRRALQLRPADTSALNHLGDICRLCKKWTEAETLLQQCLALHATNPHTHLNLAALYHDQGRMAQALAAYQRVLLLTPGDADTQFLAAALGDNPPAQVPGEQVKTLFDASAETFDRELVRRLHYQGPELLKSALAPPPRLRSLAVMDLGCGTGLCGLQFRDWASTLVGVDLAPKMLAKARARGIYDELVLSDLVPALAERQGMFDLVLAGDVLIYLGELGPLFQAVAQALRQGGRFAFTVELFEGTGYQVLPTVRYAHSRGYLRAMARASNLQEVTMTPAAIRRQAGQDVAGLVVVLAK